MSVGAPAAGPHPAVRSEGGVVPRLCAGTRLIGPYEGSGFREPHYLVARADQRVVHLPRLLFLVVESIDGRRDVSDVADRVSAAFGRRLTVDGLQHVMDTKLRPLGLVEAPAATAATVSHDTPLLALRLHRVLLPAGAVRALGRLLAPLFAPVAVVAVLAAAVAMDGWLLLGQDITAALRAVALDPPLILVTLGLLLASTLFHELGHAAGCTYGGGRPGVIGMGVYLVVPAFYTNVTDAYRLDRRGRLRTDLGGLYFNAVFLLGLGAAYAATGWAPLLVVVALTNLEMLQQLLPVVRLDGYFILADLVGVPDLFGRVRPIMSGLLPGRDVHPAVRELRPRARVVVTGWVLVVVPLLVTGLGLLLWRLPALLVTTVDSARAQWTLARAAAGAGAYAEVVLAAVSLLLLAVPLAGLLALGGHLVVRAIGPPSGDPAPRHASRPGKALMDSLTRTPNRPGLTLPTTGSAEPGRPRFTAASFTEELFLRRRSRPPAKGWRRLLYRLSLGRVNVGPSRAEQRELELVARARTPVRGSRRVVVLSRKGGAGKTTTTLMLGHTFARQRGDRVVALDANPDAGSLANRLRRETDATVTTLLHDRELIDRYADIRGYTSQAMTRLEVIASDDDPRISQALGEADYRQVIDLLDRHYNLVLVDTGTGILDDAIQGILKEADQLVLVMPPALDGARVAAATLDWLDAHGYDWLVRGSVAVINGVRGGELVELERVEEHFSDRCVATVRIPWDSTLEAGALTSLGELRPATRAAYLQLAALVADGFREPTERGRRS
ncbi:MAG TPA: MinD/ParA family protein [Actinomycetes bacterium]